MRKERPRVGIIYSGGPQVSLQSASLAKYIGAHLAATGIVHFGDSVLILSNSPCHSLPVLVLGWCTVCLIPFSPRAIPDLSNERIRYYPINSSKPIDAPVCHPPHFFPHPWTVF
jgi:hypothetical protein